MANILSNIVTEITGEKRFWTHWQWYKKVFGEAIFKFFVSFVSLLPIIAKIFQQPAQENTMTLIETQLKNVFSWQLLWIAAILYLAAYTLYSIFCPKFIRTYNNYKDYKDYQHSPRWLVWLAQESISDKNQIQKFINRLAIKNYITKTVATPAQIDKQDRSEINVENKQTVLSFTYNGTNYIFGMPILDSNGLFDKSATEIAEQEIFWEIFGRFSSNRKYIRLFISIFLICSFLLFAVVIIQYMISMTKFIF